MSFNVRGALMLDGRDAWWRRRALVGELLARERPAIVGFQEVQWPASRDLARALAGHALVEGHRVGGRLVGATNPLWVARAALALHGGGGFYLSRTPERRSHASGARQVRAATWAMVADGARRLLVVNTHLDHGEARARDEAAAVLLERLALLGWPRVPALLCGDFNADAGGPLHRRLLDAGFADTWLATGGRDDADAFTCHGFTGRRGGDGRIDWILCSPPLRPTRAAILRDARDGRFPSDHFPVIAELEWAA